MFKKLILLVLIALCVQQVAYASRLIRYIEKQEARERRHKEREIQQDMNFADMNFRFEKRYVDEYGKHCRDYVARSRSNPFRKGFYTVCN